jgi:uncharacterized protein YebE (UPF0316 family)
MSVAMGVTLCTTCDRSGYFDLCDIIFIPARLQRMETALLSLAIFSLRLVDVSIGTLRIVMLVRGRRWTAGGLGFFESLTWVLAAGLVLTNLDSPYKIVAFAAGYATGTVLGSTIERHLALGHTILRIVTAADQPSPAHRLRERGFGVTEVNGSGMNGEVRIAFSVVSRRDTPAVLRDIHEVSPNAYVTVEDTTTPDLGARRRRVRP